MKILRPHLFNKLLPIIEKRANAEREPTKRAKCEPTKSESKEKTPDEENQHPHVKGSIIVELQATLRASFEDRSTSKKLELINARNERAKNVPQQHDNESTTPKTNKDGKTKRTMLCSEAMPDSVWDLLKHPCQGVHIPRVRSMNYTF